MKQVPQYNIVPVALLGALQHPLVGSYPLASKQAPVDRPGKCLRCPCSLHACRRDAAAARRRAVESEIFFPNPSFVRIPGGKPQPQKYRQREKARAKRWEFAVEPDFPLVRLCVDPETQQIAPPTRAPAGCGPTDARHSRHARSRSHHGHRAATVTTESLQAAGKLPCATTLSSRRRRRHATAASSDFFCVPFGGRASGRVSTPPTPSATTAARRRVRRLHLRHRLRRLRPALPASTAHLRRDVQLGFRRRLQRLQPRLGVPPGPGPSTAGGRVDRTIVTCGRNSKEVKSSQVNSRWNPSVISAHSLPPLLAAGAHSIGFRMVVCCLCINLNSKH
jgi:hypothetical protein